MSSRTQGSSSNRGKTGNQSVGENLGITTAINRTFPIYEHQPKPHRASKPHIHVFQL